jgi:hypothetical protein
MSAFGNWNAVKKRKSEGVKKERESGEKQKKGVLKPSKEN